MNSSGRVTGVSESGAFGSPFLYPPARARQNGWPPEGKPPVGGAMARRGDPSPRGEGRRLGRRLGAGLGDLAAPNAARTDPNPARRVAHHHTDGLQVGQPTTLATVVRMRDVIAGRRPLAAGGADVCHDVLQNVEGLTAIKVSFGVVGWQYPAIGRRRSGVGTRRGSSAGPVGQDAPARSDFRCPASDSHDPPPHSERPTCPQP